MTATEKNILIVSGLKVFPATTGGHIHTGHLATALARLGYNTRIFSLAGRREHYVSRRSSCLREILEPCAEEWTHLGLVNGLIQTTHRRLGIPHLWPAFLMQHGWIPEELKQSLLWADAILYNQPYCAPIPGPWASKPRYLISHNLEYRILEQGTAREQRYVGQMLEREKQAPTLYSDILACAEEDRDFFRQHDKSGQLRLPIVRSGIDPDAYITPPGTRERIRAELQVEDDERLIIFAGSSFGPNLEALARIKEFCRREYEWLKAQRIRMLLAGSMEAAPHREGVMISTGRVTEMPPYFAASDAGLNPITTGSGGNVKLFEYMGVRLPVLSTRFGVRGSTLKSGRDYIEFAPDELRGALNSLLAHTRNHWRTHAEEVWQRHRSSCDIQEIVRQAILELRHFPALGNPAL